MLQHILLYFSKLKCLFQEYLIEITVGTYTWTVKHRYSDFFELHEKVRIEMFPFLLQIEMFNVGFFVSSKIMKDGDLYFT